MTKEKFEVGKTYIFFVGGGHFRGLVVKRTAKTITVKFSDEGTCYLHRMFTYEDVANVKPTTLRIKDDVVNCEYAITRSAGKYKKTQVDGFADNLAREQM
jgi:hypothetical protein